MDAVYLAALQTIHGIGSSRIRTLVSYFGSAEQVWQADKRDLFLSGLDEDLCNNLAASREKIDVHKLSAKWDKAGVKLVTLYDSNYPEQLARIYNPPAVLFYKGILPDTIKAIAIVGARKASSYGRNACSLLSGTLAAAGVCIVSGAARGIDTAAHTGAVDRGKTIAVLGNGVDIAYPPENAGLIARIAEQGAVISEYPPGVKPHPAFFPARNRIISGLVRGVIVVEAAERSGSLITADFALEEGRDVFAVPGSIFAENSKGVHNLVKQGAKLVDCAEDILVEYGWQVLKDNSEVNVKVSEEEMLIIRSLDFEIPRGIDELVMVTKLSLTTLTYLLLQLELRGLILNCGGQHYLRTTREGIR